MVGKSRSGLVVVLVLVAGCSVGAPPDDTAPPSSAAAPSPQQASPTPTPSAEDLAGQVALAAYRGMWADFVTAGTTSDWRSPDLGRHATGVALTNLSRGR